ncbi:MAG: translation elongation factor 4 [Endomicrobia bacterium]|nr:translation elongation factor 4 [Endomicrobiia bacterium]
MIENIRNFCIIAHIDHGKSTLADRFLEVTNTVPKRLMQEQILDSMELERERGITIRSKTIRMEYYFENTKYILNLIDTPGHVDFTYEVMRVVNACEAAILVVDATQGVEAQTLSNTLIAQKAGLKILPVINKIDLPNASVELTQQQIRDFLKIEHPAIKVSAKTGYGVEELLSQLIKIFPSPTVYNDSVDFASALVFDAYYDPYRFVIMYVKVLSGELKKDMQFKFLTANDIKTYKVEEVGYIKLQLTATEKISAGEVGYIIAGIKDIHSVKIGDVIMDAKITEEEIDKLKNLIPQSKEAKPFVFAGIYPMSPKDYDHLKISLQKLHLTDYSLQFKPISSKVLGAGFHCGFLGSLHLDIVKERLEREYNLDLIITFPNVEYKIVLDNGTEKIVNSSADFPEYHLIKKIYEPITLTTIVTPLEYLSNVIETCKQFRGEVVDQNFIDENHIIIQIEIPLSEIIINFFDAIKSVSKGYASFDYEQVGYKEADLVKLEVLVNNEVVDSFCFITHKTKAYPVSLKILEKLKKTIPRHLFTIALQVRCQGKIIAREDIGALRKDVLAKCYGGDITRKRKLLEKQKEGKKRMKQIGSVEIPKETFIELLKI